MDFESTLTLTKNQFYTNYSDATEGSSMDSGGDATYKAS
jgi:hypothetical protein